MFRTLGNTWQITKTAFGVLRQDKELLWFPIFGMVGIAIVVGIAAAVGAAAGSLDRLSNEESLTAGDMVIGVVALVAGLFVLNYFNAALMGAARHRLKGGDPNLRTGFAAVNPHLGAVLGWSVISAIILIILQYIRGKQDSFLGRLLVDMVGAVWAYMTFFVVPVLIVEGIGPIEAVKRSAGYFRRTWGEQLVSNFGFGIVRFVAILPAVLLGALLFPLSPVAAVIVVLPAAALGMAVVNSLEGIFKMALYMQVAEDQTPLFFEKDTLTHAYTPSTSAYRGRSW